MPDRYTFFVKDGNVLLRARDLHVFEIWGGGSWSPYKGDRAKVREQAWTGRVIAEETIVMLGGTPADLDRE